MKASIGVGGYDRSDSAQLVEYVQAAERLGVNTAWSAEAWGADAATALAFLAGRTERIRLGTGIMQISARAPSMTAMTALSLHHLSGGRFSLGLRRQRPAGGGRAARRGLCPPALAAEGDGRHHAHGVCG